jgi:uncharacterized damage-inducible protein DinB
MTIGDLRDLLDYHYWARDRMFAALDALSDEQYTRDLGSSFRSIRDTAVHVYGAEWVWLQRWQGESPTALITPDTIPDVSALKRAWAELEPKVRAFLDVMEQRGVDQTNAYTLFSGDRGESPFWQILQHVVNHASYHRGQITAMLRQVGADPPKSMDLIAFYRSRKVSV